MRAATFSAEADPATTIEDIATAKTQNAQSPDVKASPNLPAQAEAQDLRDAPDTSDLAPAAGLAPAVLTPAILDKPAPKAGLLSRLMQHLRTARGDETSSAFSVTDPNLEASLNATSKTIADQQAALNQAARPLAQAIYDRIEGAKAKIAFNVRGLIVTLWGRGLGLSLY